MATRKVEVMPYMCDVCRDVEVRDDTTVTKAEYKLELFCRVHSVDVIVNGSVCEDCMQRIACNLDGAADV